MSNTIEVAKKFVLLSLNQECWGRIDDRSSEEYKTVLDLLKAAAHNPKCVVRGTLVRHYRDEDSWSAETYPINEIFPFKVLDQEDQDHDRWTGWLDCIYRLVVSNARLAQTQIAQIIETEIEHSQRLWPIQLTVEGDYLIEGLPNLSSSGYKYLVRHARDEHLIDEVVLGIHSHCRGRLERFQTSETHDIALCRKCYLRVSFPRTVKTYSDLRQALAFKLARMHS